MGTTRAIWNLSVLVILSHVVDTNIQTFTSKNVRLMNGYTPYDGLVEVRLTDQEWTPVCQGNWDLDEADILCNELVPGNVNAMRRDKIGDVLANDPRPRINDMICTGNETSIIDCPYDEHKSCRNSAGAKCNYFGYLGCYNHSRNNPLLPDGSMVSDNMTIQLCLDYCRQFNTSYAGLYGRLKNGEMTCFCGLQNSTYWSNGEAVHGKCNKECLGDTSQVCGGQNELSVYNTNLGACGANVVSGSGIIYSPGFPGFYFMRMECLWTITTPEETSVFIEFVINYTIGNVMVFEELHNEYVDLVIENGTAMSCSNKVSIQFTSDGSVDRKGLFAIEYTGFTPDCQPPPNILSDVKHFKFIGLCPYFVEDTISIICNSGHELSSPHHIIVCQEDGTWNDSFPSCKYIPPAKTTPLPFTDISSEQPYVTSKQSTMSTNTGVIIGAVVSVVLVLLIGSFVAYFVYRRKFKKHPIPSGMHFLNRQYGDIIKGKGEGPDEIDQHTPMKNTTPYEVIVDNGDGHLNFKNTSPCDVIESVNPQTDLNNDAKRGSQTLVVENDTGEVIELPDRKDYVISGTGKPPEDLEYAYAYGHLGNTAEASNDHESSKTKAKDNSIEGMENEYESADTPNVGFVDNIIYEDNDMKEGITTVEHVPSKDTSSQDNLVRDGNNTMVENVAYESAGANDVDYTDENVYSAIDDDVTNGEKGDVARENTDNMAIPDEEDVKYYVLEGPGP
ncbi:uncharacterized protein LOC144448281 [Glandiceps talaboti]